MAGNAAGKPASLQSALGEVDGGGVQDDHGLLAIPDPDEIDGGEMEPGDVDVEESDAMEPPFDENDELDIESELDPAIDAELESEGIAED